MDRQSTRRYVKESMNHPHQTSRVVGICNGCQSVFHEEPKGEILEPFEWREDNRWENAFEEHVQFDTPDGCPDDSEYYLEAW